jgi:hypothetical protein
VAINLVIFLWNERRSGTSGKAIKEAESQEVAGEIM